MPVYGLTDEISFPNPRFAGEDGLVAVGGDLRLERLVSAYASGIFPWPMRDMPLVWFSPNPRMVLTPRDVHISRSLRKRIKRREFEVRMDTDFREVVRACATVPRGGGGTWITPEMQEAYVGLHEIGIAHSVEVWQAGTLVGGLYGVSIGDMFCGESMFHRVTDASKMAFVSLALQLNAWRFDLLDCQLYTAHLHSLGAREVPRDVYLDRLHSCVRRPSRQRRWELEIDPAELV